MIPLEERNFVISACQKLQERGWFPGKEFVSSSITEQDIATFEQAHQVKLPSLYRAFLTSFRLPQNIRNDNFLCSIIEDKGDLGPLWLAIDCPQSMNLSEDGLLHGSKALPDLKKLLELYFYGALEKRFEQEEGIKPTYEWYQDTLKR